MDNDNFLLAVAVVAVLISFVGFTVTYNSVSSFQNYMSGFIIENGSINLSIQSLTLINITEVGGSPTGDYSQKALNYGAGYVNETIAHLYTHNGTVRGGTWSPIQDGFVIKNIGTNNVTLNVSLDDTAATFFGTGGGSLQYNLTNHNRTLDTEDVTSQACGALWTGNVNNTYVEFTTTATEVCSVFPFGDFGRLQDEIMMDIHIAVPSGAGPNQYDTVLRLTYT